MRTYLTEIQAETALKAGKTVELFLGRATEDPEVLRWVDLKWKDKAVVVTSYEVFDEGNQNFLDLYSFSFVDPDMDFPQDRFGSLPEAIKHLQIQYHLKDFKFVNRGMIQDEYGDLLIKEGKE